MNDRNCANHTEGGCSSWDCNFKKRIDARQAIAYMKYVRALVAKEENEGNFTNAVDMAIKALETCDKAIFAAGHMIDDGGTHVEEDEDEEDEE